jgi:1-acyl-sn-glycerol-3-phosphate acyltransferase
VNAILPKVEPVYGFSHALIKVFYDAAFRGEIVGLENLPKHRAFLVASNHASHLDAPIVGLHVGRQVSFFARKTLWKPGIAAWWLDAVRTIPVDRDGGTDVAAFKRVIQALKEGRTIIVFPEGTRSSNGQLQSAKGGVGLIACKTQVPVVPARVFGSFEALGRSSSLRLGTPIDVVYGPPLLPEAYDQPEAGKERYHLAASRIMEAIAQLRRPERPIC